MHERDHDQIDHETSDSPRWLSTRATLERYGWSSRKILYSLVARGLIDPPKVLSYRTRMWDCASIDRCIAHAPIAALRRKQKRADQSQGRAPIEATGGENPKTSLPDSETTKGGKT